jgi:thioredoxin-like negative regulator of GroEL
VVHQHVDTAAETGYCLSTQATAANIRQVNAEELEAAIAARDKPIVVDFFATCKDTCRPGSAVLQ